MMLRLRRHYYAAADCRAPRDAADIAATLLTPLFLLRRHAIIDAIYYFRAIAAIYAGYYAMTPRRRRR
jgi:hypothetical protein